MNKYYSRWFLNYYISIFLDIVLYLMLLLFILCGFYLGFVNKFLVLVFLIIFISFIFTDIRKKYYKVKTLSLVLNYGKTIIPFKSIRSVLFSLAYISGKGHYYPRKKANGTKIYVSNVSIYLKDISNVKKEYYNERITNTMFDQTHRLSDDCISENYNMPRLRTKFEDLLEVKQSIYDFNCYDFKSIKDMLEISQAKIYVTRSYLYFNKWTINEFAKIIDVDICRITMINDNPLYGLSERDKRILKFNN